MTLAPGTDPAESWISRFRECNCAICHGAGEGAGYRPHTLKDDCWCTNGRSAYRACREVRNWNLTDTEIGEAGSSPERKDRCGLF